MRAKLARFHQKKHVLGRHIGSAIFYFEIRNQRPQKSLGNHSQANSSKIVKVSAKNHVLDRHIGFAILKFAIPTLDS